MKFKIRYADQIVGFFSIFALVVLVVLVFALGARQNWFVRKNVYYTQFDSGASISAGMDITYKGFGIGKIKKISLEHDKVLVEFYILDDYMDYVRPYSLLEFSSNILGLGTSFVWHPGPGSGTIEPGSEIYRYDSAEGIAIRRQYYGEQTGSSDAITAILNKVEPLMDSVTRLINDLDAVLTGEDMVSKSGVIMPNQLAATIRNINEVLTNVGVLTRDLTALTAKLGSEDGAVAALVGDEGWQALLDILQKVDGLLVTVDDSVGGLSAQAGSVIDSTTPQLDAALRQVDTLLLELQDVLTGVKNNPLIRNGVPDRSQEASATPNLREGAF